MIQEDESLSEREKEDEWYIIRIYIYVQGLITKCLIFIAGAYK